MSGSPVLTCALLTYDNGCGDVQGRWGRGLLGQKTSRAEGEDVHDQCIAPLSLSWRSHFNIPYRWELNAWRYV